MNQERLSRLWPAVAAAVSAAMLAAAHAFESFGGYAPCALCLRQREVYWTALAVAVVGLALMQLRRLPARAVCAVLGLVFLVGLGTAAYHAGVEWKWWPGPTTCSGAGGGVAVTGDLTALLEGKRVRPPACDEAAWRMFGLSMAGYNAIISAGLVVVSLAFAKGSRHEP